FLDAQRAGRSYIYYLEKLKPVIERYGNRPLASLTGQDGVHYKKWLINEKEWVSGDQKMKGRYRKVRGLVETSVNHYLRSAKSFLNWCTDPERDWLPRNPWKSVKLCTARSRERLITAEEFNALCVQADPDFRELLVFLRHTTCRPQ